MSKSKKENLFIASLHYYCLPEFPAECSFNFNTELFLRDMLACSNIQRENHYEYPKFQNFSYDIGCNGRNLPTIIKNYLSGKDVYILFRTTLKGTKASRSFISGYYKISEPFILKTKVLGNKTFCGFNSNENVFLRKKDSSEWEMPLKRGVVYSENKDYKEYLLTILNKYKNYLDSSKNQFQNYQEFTIKWIKNLQDKNYRIKILETCSSCQIDECLLKKKLEYYQKYSKNEHFIYLDYLYHPGVYLSDYIEKLKEKKKIKYLEVK